MTDLEIFKKMVENRGISYEENPSDGLTTFTLLTFESEQKYGYLGFIVGLYFNLDGSLFKIGAWE